MLSSLTLSIVLASGWEPTAANYESLIKAIQPSAKENKWKDIGWRSQFWPAVKEARELGRPILLWTMNGHPLGCT